MNRRLLPILGLAVAACWLLPAAAQPPGPAPAAEPRELIYCADLMTPEEREAYRVSMRAARGPQERAALRQTHRDRMHARARESGVDVLQCEPQHQRQRLRLRGGAP
jgi:hypothetical protein